MLKRFLLLLVATGALAANAATISFQPTTQTINLGDSTTVDVQVGGLTAGQAIGAFDFFVLNNASIITPTSILYLSSLGDPTMQLTGSAFAGGSAEASEVSFESTATLLGLQSSQPFSLFRLTYTAVGIGTSSLTLGSPLILADGDGTILPPPTVTAGSITVMGSTTSPVPEPSTLALLGTGGVWIASALRRRRA